MTELTATNVSVQVKQSKLVDQASFTLKPGELTALLGPNGAGKTSLIRASLGLVDLSAGSVELNGQDIAQLDAAARARQLAYLPQIRPLAWPNLVRDVVALGRFSHGMTLGRLGERDADAVDRAIEACDLTHLADRHADTLSGGELARMHCARAFAAETPLLIADEPIAALDPRHQFRILDLIKDYVSNGGGALVVIHDIALAARYAHRLIWMKEGRVLADGTVEETLAAERIEAVYGIKARIDGKRVEMDGPV